MLLSLLRRESQYCALLVYTGRSPQRGVLLSSIAPSLPAIAEKRSHYSLDTTRTQLVLRTPRSPSQLSMMGLSSSLLNTPAGKFVQDTIDSECVVIFSSTTCGFCKMAKGVFSQMRVPFTAIELNTRKDGLFIRDVLEEITGQTTVRHLLIFILTIFINLITCNTVASHSI